jgi:hypothetical protein
MRPLTFVEANGQELMSREVTQVIITYDDQFLSNLESQGFVGQIEYCPVIVVTSRESTEYC